MCTFERVIDECVIFLNQPNNQAAPHEVLTVKIDDEQYFNYKRPKDWLRIEITHIVYICWNPLILDSTKILKCLSWSWKRLAWKLDVLFFVYPPGKLFNCTRFTTKQKMYCLGFKSLNTVRSISSCFYFGVNVKTCHTLLQIMSQGKLEKQPLGEGNLPRDVYIIIIFFDF